MQISLVPEAEAFWSQVYLRLRSTSQSSRPNAPMDISSSAPPGHCRARNRLPDVPPAPVVTGAAREVPANLILPCRSDRTRSRVAAAAYTSLQSLRGRYSATVGSTADSAGCQHLSVNATRHGCGGRPRAMLFGHRGGAGYTAIKEPASLRIVFKCLTLASDTHRTTRRFLHPSR